MSEPRRFEKLITYCGQRARVACDGNCSKAWGINNRPLVQLSSTNEDDYAWLADDELGEAPSDPGTYEGGQAKPVTPAGPDDMNKWCVRECERCVMSGPGQADHPLVLRDFSQRIYNMPSGQPPAKGTERPWRHGTRQTYVFEADGKQWMFTTEISYDDGMQFYGPIECVEVHKVERTVTVWEPVP